ncbi:unnamed protein product [Victoria cruziana]
MCSGRFQTDLSQAHKDGSVSDNEIHSHQTRPYRHFFTQPAGALFQTVGRLPGVAAWFRRLLSRLLVVPLSPSPSSVISPGLAIVLLPFTLRPPQHPSSVAGTDRDQVSFYNNCRQEQEGVIFNYHQLL